MFFTVLLRISCIVVCICASLCVPKEFAPKVLHFVLYSLGVSGGVASKDDYLRLLDFYHSTDAGHVVYSQPTFYDHIILVKELGSRFHFTKWTKKLPFPMNLVGHRRVRVERARSNKLTAYSACATEKVPVLPVVIRYTSHEPWTTNTSFLVQLLRRLCGPIVRYKLHVLPPVFPQPNESLDHFNERVAGAMEAVPLYEASSLADAYKGSALLTFTSTMFAIPAVLCWAKGMYVPALGMLFTCLNSIRFHSSGCHHAKFVDIVSNFACGSYFTIRCLITENWLTVSMAFVAVLANVFITTEKNSIRQILMHAVGLHIPALIGFMSLALSST